MADEAPAPAPAPADAVADADAAPAPTPVSSAGGVGGGFKLNLSGIGKGAPKRLQRTALSKAAIGVAAEDLLEKPADVDYVKAIVDKRMAPVNERKKEVLVIPLAANPWEKPQKMAASNAAGVPTKRARQEAAPPAAIPEDETEEERLNREAAAALLRDASGGGDDDDEENNSFVIAMQQEEGGAGREMSQLERVMAHKKAFEKDEATGKALTEKEKLQKEMAMRPEANEFHSEAYEKVAVSDFGRAMLLGMGWQPPSKGGKDDVKAYEPQARPGRVGLGAATKPWEKKRNDDPNQRLKPGEKRHEVGCCRLWC